MLKYLLQSIFYWVCFTILLVTIRFLGIEFFFENETNFPLQMTYITSIPGGILMGIVWVTVDILLKKYFLIKARSFGVVVAVMTLTFVFIIVIVIFFATWVMSGSLEFALKYSSASIAISNIIFSLIGAFLFVFFQNLDQRMGPGMLYKYLTGKYFDPREEERIFLFLDLKSSTSIAEQLGHESYSQFLQDCYRLLTFPVRETDGEIYQYVGDEVVISWQSKGGIALTNCIDFFFLYAAKLNEHQSNFMKRYNISPHFKAAAHIGKVMVAEVGQLKTEIAFHGDVLNTTSRIQEYCNQLSESFLITDLLKAQLPSNTTYSFHSHGPISLKGKENEVEVFGVRENI